MASNKLARGACFRNFFFRRGLILDLSLCGAASAFGPRLEVQATLNLRETLLPQSSLIGALKARHYGTAA